MSYSCTCNLAIRKQTNESYEVGGHSDIGIEYTRIFSLRLLSQTEYSWTIFRKFVSFILHSVCYSGARHMPQNKGTHDSTNSST